jgi:hypothetical protein
MPPFLLRATGRVAYTGDIQEEGEDEDTDEDTMATKMTIVAA